MPSSPPWVCTRGSGWVAPRKVQDRCSARSLTPCSRWTVSTTFHFGTSGEKKTTPKNYLINKQNSTYWKCSLGCKEVNRKKSFFKTLMQIYECPHSSKHNPKRLKNNQSYNLVLGSRDKWGCGDLQHSVCKFHFFQSPPPANTNQSLVDALRRLFNSWNNSFLFVFPINPGTKTNHSSYEKGSFHQTVIINCRAEFILEPHLPFF